MNFEPRNLFITGGAGFIGSNFVHHWLANTQAGRVVVFDALTYAGNIDNLSDIATNPRYLFVKGDICDEANVRALLEQHQIDTIAHFAAESHVDRSILGPDDFIRTNVVGTHSLLKAAKSLWIDRKIVPAHRFHHVSTDEVYGSLGPNDAPFHESSPYAPNSPYSASKAASDHLVRAYHETYGLNTTVTNCSNNYGPYHFPEKLIPLIILNALEGKPLPVYGKGANIRDWLYVEDHARALHLILTKGRLGETYNVGGRNERTNLDVVQTVCRILDEIRPDKKSHDRLVTFVPDRPGHDHRYAIDATKLENELGWKAEETFASGIRKTVHWYLENEWWWGPLRKKVYRGERIGLLA